MRDALIGVFSQPYYSGWYVHRALDQLGIEHVNFDYREIAWQKILSKIQDCDTMLVLKGEILPPQFYGGFKGKKYIWYFDVDICVACKEYGTSPHPGIPLWAIYNSKEIDKFFTIARGMVDAYKSLDVENVEWLPEAYDPT